jgi:hypothetical protein
MRALAYIAKLLEPAKPTSTDRPASSLRDAQQGCIGSMNFGSTLGGTMGKGRERQIILKTNQRTLVPESGLGESSKRNQSIDENRMFLEGDVLEVAVRDDRWV